MVELKGSEIFAPEAEDRELCQRAAEMAVDSRVVMSVSTIRSACQLGEAATKYVSQGLAWISLQGPNYDYRGLTQEEAWKTIDRIYGRVTSPNAIINQPEETKN